jgi:hypothetical protein
LTNSIIRWYGQLLRMNKERIANKVLNIKVNGKRPRGRSRSRSEGQIRKGVTQKEGKTRGEAEEEKLWEDRDRWRCLVFRRPT